MINEYFSIIYPAVKRLLDIAISATLLVVLSPLFVGLYLAVRLTSEGPALFKSERIGRYGKLFFMPKFRSMTTHSKVISRESVKEGDIKLTPIGNFIRKTSLDELPQLWSVLKGDMSLIGPRPLLHNDHGNSTRSSYPEIYSVRPGMTGLAQVNGRNFISSRNKSRYDKFYAVRSCLWLDTKIAVKTIGVVLNTKQVM